MQPRRVAEVFRFDAALINLKVFGRVIRTTAEHPFWVDGNGWTRAADLIEGDRLRSHDGRWAVVMGVEDCGETAPVYNLRIDRDHTYFVGARAWGFSVWAHNAYNKPRENDVEGWTEYAEETTGDLQRYYDRANRAREASNELMNKFRDKYGEAFTLDMQDQLHNYISQKNYTEEAIEGMLQNLLGLK